MTLLKLEVHTLITGQVGFDDKVWKTSQWISLASLAQTTIESGWGVRELLDDHITEYYLIELKDFYVLNVSNRTSEILS